MSPACENAPHETKTLYDAGHWVVAMYLIFEIDKAFVLDRNESFEDAAYRHDSVAHVNLAVPALRIRQILDVYVEHPRTHCVDSLNHSSHSHPLSG